MAGFASLKALVGLFPGLTGTPQLSASEIYLNTLFLVILISSISSSNYDTGSEPGPTTTPPHIHFATMSPHAHLQVLFTNTISPPMLATSNTTLSPSHHMHACKPLSTNEGEDVLPLLRNLPCTLAIPHQQHSTTYIQRATSRRHVTTHTPRAATSHRHVTIPTQQGSSRGRVIIHTQSALSRRRAIKHTRSALSRRRVTTRTLASPLRSLPHGYLCM